jgi:Transposase DDE domain
VAIPQRALRGGERVVNFGAGRCNNCPLKPRCAPSAGGRKLTIARREDLLQAGRAALQDADTDEHLRRTRPQVERLIGLLANRYGARENRYIGSAKGRLQPVGPPRWSISTRSAIAWPPRPHTAAWEPPIRPSSTPTRSAPSIRARIPAPAPHKPPTARAEPCARRSRQNDFFRALLRLGPQMSDFRCGGSRHARSAVRRSAPQRPAAGGLRMSLPAARPMTHPATSRSIPDRYNNGTSLDAGSQGAWLGSVSGFPRVKPLGA